MTSEGASSRPPEGRNNPPDPSWTPKEPRRPFRPKASSFGPSYSKPIDDLPIAGIKPAEPPEETHGS